MQGVFNTKGITIKDKFELSKFHLYIVKCINLI